MQGRQTNQAKNCGQPKGVTTFNSYRSRSSPSTCPGAPRVLLAGTVPRGRIPAVLTPWGTGHLGVAVAGEFRHLWLQQQQQSSGSTPALASPRNPSARHFAHSLWPFLALKPAENRAGGLRCQGLQSGFPGVCFGVWQAQGGPGTVSPSVLSPA